MELTRRLALLPRNVAFICFRCAQTGLADQPHIALDLVTRALERAGYMAVTEMVPQSSLTSVLECLQTAVIEATQNVQTPTQTGQKTSSRRRPYAVCSSRGGPHYRPAGCPR